MERVELRLKDSKAWLDAHPKYKMGYVRLTFRALDPAHAHAAPIDTLPTRAKPCGAATWRYPKFSCLA